MSEPVPTAAQIEMTQMLAIRSQGDAADHDPVLINMQARSLAHLERISPGATGLVRAFFEDMKTKGIDPRAALP
jgi:hypothetical protein